MRTNHSKVEPLVSARTLFAAGLVTIAIVSLATVVIVQQIALQEVSRQSPVTPVYSLPIVGIPSSTSSTSAPTADGYVMVYYSGTRLWKNVPCEGCIWFGLWVVVENHGFDGFGQLQVSRGDFYVVVGGRQFASSEKGESLAERANLFPGWRVFSGNSMAGWIIYQLPFSTIGKTDFTILFNQHSQRASRVRS